MNFFFCNIETQFHRNRNDKRSNNNANSLCCYHDFFDVFNKAILKILFKHASHNHVINIGKNMFSFESIYNLFMFELKIRREYLNKNLINDFIVFFIFSIDSFILFIIKKNDSFRLL